MFGGHFFSFLELNAEIPFGTIHLRRRHFLGGRCQKFAKFANGYLIVKNVDRGGYESKIVKICLRLKWMVSDVIH